MQDAVNEASVKKQAGSPRRRNKSAIALMAVVAAAAVVVAVLWWWRAQAYESTDDAFIAGHVSAVSPQVAGRVLDVLVTDNQQVETGDVLVKLDPATFQVRVDQAKADLREAEEKLQESRSRYQVALADVEKAKADAVSAEAQTGNATTDLSRYNHLIGSGAVSQQARDNADTLARTSAAALQSARKHLSAVQAQADLAATQIQTAGAGVEKCRAALERVNLDLSYTDIKAGVSGRVTVKSVEPGDYVQVGQTILSLVENNVWVLANFKETQLKGMRPGQPVTISVDAYPEHEFKGHVDSFQAGTGAAFSLLPPENASGNYVKVVQRVPVKIVFDLLSNEAGMHLAPGMSVVPQVRVR
jgi:membrane fusion protein (multidrug efflux system)